MTETTKANLTLFPMYTADASYPPAIDPLTYVLRAKSGNWSIDLTKGNFDEQMQELNYLASSAKSKPPL